MFTDKIAAAVDQARNDAASAIERHVERAKVAATGVVEQARGSIALSTAPVPCSVCGRSTRGGDGGACNDVGEMTSKIEASDEAPKCYSCLSAEERDKELPQTFAVGSSVPEFRHHTWVVARRSNM
ncbi:unnamed protein product [Symbiodinium necroappetens]|uniref:Uncharacterized protein n=1 Tax=Symbiodinium necroappetens TaxID=1628268 RepID=A0A813BZF3_9DINO|nr:unnamed protein product [Symbiodinium necroappetens]